jgi:hypothetical protein
MKKDHAVRDLFSFRRLFIFILSFTIRATFYTTTEKKATKLFHLHKF